MRKSDTKPQLLPSPWDDPFARFDAFLNEVFEVIRLTNIGVRMLVRYPKMLEPAALRQVERGLDTAEGAKEKIARAKEAAQAAEELIQKEFSVLLAHLIVGLWSALEALVSGIVLTSLLHRQNSLATEKLAKIKIPLSLLNESDPELRMMHVVEEISQHERFHLTVGAEGFEGLLGVVGLSAPIGDELRRNLFETSQVRNLVVHKGSFVDKKFNERCPWLGVSVGTRFEVTADRFHTYAESISEYTSALYERVRKSLK